MLEMRGQETNLSYGDGGGNFRKRNEANGSRVVLGYEHETLLDQRRKEIRVWD